MFLTGFYAATSLSHPVEKCCSVVAIVAVVIRRRKLFQLAGWIEMRNIPLVRAVIREEIKVYLVV